MRYQWGIKHPLTFATNSEQCGGVSNERGKYPVKIYTIDGVLIYQESNGSSNTDKQPIGGVIVSSTKATSMMETIKNPVVSYGGSPSTVINQAGQTKDLWDYYWTSHSRGTDGIYLYPTNSPNRHNIYLADYKSQRSKSIYDPCPYGFRVPSNGTYNQFKTSEWKFSNYAGGTAIEINTINSWYCNSGIKLQMGYTHVGVSFFYSLSTKFSFQNCYALYSPGNFTVPNLSDRGDITGMSVRCIDFPMYARLAVSTCHVARLN